VYSSYGEVAHLQVLLLVGELVQKLVAGVQNQLGLGTAAGTIAAVVVASGSAYWEVALALEVVLLVRLIRR
jgi:hypothetical protein